MAKGSCMCGAVTFTVDGPLGDPNACHCHTCRKQSGHYFVGGSVDKSALHIRGEDHVGWYTSSEKVERGFCKDCGTPLFFRPFFHDWISIAMGAFDGPTGTKMTEHIFVAEKGDYYEITDGLPQNAY